MLCFFKLYLLAISDRRFKKRSSDYLFLKYRWLYLSSIKVLSFFSIQYKCFKCVSKSRIAFVNFSQEHFGYLSYIDKCSKLLLLKYSVKKKTVTGMKMRHCKISRVDFVNPIKSITQPFYKKAIFFSNISDFITSNGEILEA